MHLTPEIVKIIENRGIEWNDCCIFSNSVFDEKVARAINRYDYSMSRHMLKSKVESVTITKTGKVEIWVTVGKELKRRVSNKNEVFVTSPVLGCWEYDVFAGKPGITKVKRARSVMKDLSGGAMKSWWLERLVLDHYGLKHHALFFVFENQADALLFSMAYQSRS